MLTRTNSTHSADLKPGISVAYRHFQHSLQVFTGTITAVHETRYGRRVLVQPDKREDMSLCPKWLPFYDIISYVWDEPELCECGCEIAPDGSHATECECCECCGEYPCKYPTMEDDGDYSVIDTRWYGWLKK
jgi:hypothetical protein